MTKHDIAARIVVAMANTGACLAVICRDSYSGRDFAEKVLKLDSRSPRFKMAEARLVWPDGGSAEIVSAEAVQPRLVGWGRFSLGKLIADVDLAMSRDEFPLVYHRDSPEPVTAAAALDSALAHRWRQPTLHGTEQIVPLESLAPLLAPKPRMTEEEMTEAIFKRWDGLLRRLADRTAPVVGAVYKEKQMIEVTLENVHTVFTYQKPTDEQIPRFNAITEAAEAYARVILANAPRTPARTRALNAVIDSRMMANNAIAHEGIE